MVEGDNLGDLICFHVEVDIRHVDAPSSIMHQEMMALRTLTGIWKEIYEGNGGGSNVSSRKTIYQSSEGSTTPKKVSRDYFWDGHDWRNSSVNIVAGDCTKLPTILYVWEVLLEAAL